MGALPSTHFHGTIHSFHCRLNSAQKWNSLMKSASSTAQPGTGSRENCNSLNFEINSPPDLIGRLNLSRSSIITTTSITTALPFPNRKLKDSIPHVYIPQPIVIRSILCFCHVRYTFWSIMR